MPINDYEAKLRTYAGTQVYMASHPKIRACFRGKRRPEHHGHRLWEATMDLMGLMEQERPRSVLDIGCGWGILGVHLARSCGAEVICSDADSRLEPIVLAHAELNAVPVEFRCRSFAALSADDLAKELVVGSEICYSEEVVVELQGMLDRAQQAGTGRVVIIDPGRPDFEDLCRYALKNYDADLRDHESKEDGKTRQLLTVRFD